MQVDPIAITNNYPITTTEEMKTHVQDATTGFTADADVTIAAPQAPLDIDRLLISSSSSNFYQDIATFLRKPVILASGLLSTTDVVGTTLLTKNLPQDGFLASPVYLDKIRGHLGWRGTMHLRWQVNGNRFQQGLYFLNWIPTAGSPPGQINTQLSIAAHNNTLVQRTQTFKVLIDVNCDTEAQMVIPYVSTMNFVPLSSLDGPSDYGCLGQLNLWAYQPLNAASGSLTASWTVWIHFEDIELIGPTQPQSGRIKFQASTKKKSATESEQASQDIGPVQSTLIKISSASALFSKVPFISDYATTTSWLADKLAGAASIFGWSAPINLAAVHRVNRETMPWWGNIDASDQSLPLSLSVKNQIPVLPGFSGTDVDEMDFSFLKTIPAWNNTITWNELQPSGTRLAAYSVGVLNNVFTTVAGGTTIYHWKPYEFIAQYFAYYRGSFVYTFKIVKTEFHSGRLMFAYYPQENQDTGATGTYANSHYTHREIIDVRYCNEVVFNIPYISSQPWRQTNGNAGILGEFDIYVVDPLVAPATVPNTISIIVEIAAGPDFEYACPTNAIHIPVMGLTPQSNTINFVPTCKDPYCVGLFVEGYIDADGYLTDKFQDLTQEERIEIISSWKCTGPSKFQAQSGFSNPVPQTDVCALTRGTLGGANPVDGGGCNEAATIGESITSFRAFGKKTYLMPFIGANPAPAPCVNVIPFASGPALYGGTVVTFPTIGADLYTHLSCCYILSRGGIRFKFFNETVGGEPNYPYYTYIAVTRNPGLISPVATQVVSTGISDVVSQPNSGYLQNQVIAYHQTQQNLCAEVQVPMYHLFHSRVNAQHMLNNPSGITYGTGTNNDLTTPVYICHRSPNATGSGNIFVARSFSDDTDFGLFVSIPPMAMPTFTNSQGFT